MNLACLLAAALDLYQATDRVADYRHFRFTQATLTDLAEKKATRKLLLSFSNIRPGDLRHLTSLTLLEEVNLSGTAISDGDLAQLRAFPRLRGVFLYGASIGDAGVARLSTAKGIVELDLGETKIGDRACDSINQLEHLKWLNLAGTTIGDQGISKLEGLRELEELFVPYSNVTGLTFWQLRRSKFKHLDLTSTPLRDEFLPHIFASAVLEQVKLSNTAIDGHGLQNVRGGERVSLLFLGSTRLADMNVRFLNRFTNLRHLSLANTKVTDAVTGHGSI